MNQKKAKLINKFLTVSGLIDKCKKWTDDKGKEHTLTAKSDVKRTYLNANYKERTKMSKELR